MLLWMAWGYSEFLVSASREQTLRHLLPALYLLCFYILYLHLKMLQDGHPSTLEIKIKLVYLKREEKMKKRFKTV